MKNVPDYFGELVFNDNQMRKRLSPEIYESLHKTIDEGIPLEDPSAADVIAQAMKEWALEKGATHYTHWFQPMTGVTAEKHDSFIEPDGYGGVIMEFSGRELIKGEPDASSFPSGGLRATFEARGYTIWDASSYAFIKDKVLCIPTAFCTYAGDALDKKTPLLRSMAALSRQSVRILRLFGDDETRSVKAMVGSEQEYFLIDRELYRKRKDLMYSGRTLFGAAPSKGQETDDHYYGVIKPRVAAFMADLNDELWKVGILAKTEHNEAAPSQHELAPIYTTATLATDHNQLTMEIMQKVAEKHGMECLLHEKPFQGVSGSGKHNNWSLNTDRGVNLLRPGSHPYENKRFLIFLMAVVKAVDDYQDLLRVSIATAGNDHRLGASEAPPAVISMFLGDDMTEMLKAIEEGRTFESANRKTLGLGADVLASINRDTTDRNRTSPFAFTGNKFEFRMVGSSNSIACANIMLNASVAYVLKGFADELEGAQDFDEAVMQLLRKTIREHKRIIFNGNNYDPAWLEEASRRGLSNYPTTADCMPHMKDPRNVEMLTAVGVLSEREISSRCWIILDNYCKAVTVEARTMVEMARTEILPAVEKYAADTAAAGAAKKAVVPELTLNYEKKTVSMLSEWIENIDVKTDELKSALSSITGGEIEKQAYYIRDNVLPVMEELRKYCDLAEMHTPASYWPFPTYGDLLFG